MAAKLGLLLNLTVRVAECWAWTPVAQALHGALPVGSLLQLHSESATRLLCFRNALYRDLHSAARWPLLSVQGELMAPGVAARVVPPAAYVLLGSGSWARRTVVKYPESRRGWNSSSLFLALVPRLDVGEVQATLWDAWRRQSVVDFTVITMPEEHSAPAVDQWQVFTAFPFAETTGLCGRVKTNRTFRNWRLVNSSSNQYDSNIFSPGYLNPEGYAMAMLNALTDYLNVVPRRVPAPPDQFDTTPGAPEWSWYDALAGLESGDVDVLVGQYSYTDWRYDSYCTLGPHGVSNYRWYLPVPAPSFLPIVPHLALPAVVVACMALGLLAAVAVMALASCRPASSLLDVWAMFVEQPISQTRLDGVQLASRVVVLSSLVGFVNVNVLIKSTIVTSMSHPAAFKGLETPDELAGLSKIVVGTENPLLVSLLNQSNVPAERIIVNHTEECYLNFTDCVERLQTWADSNDDRMYVLVCAEETMAFTTAGSDKDTVYTFKEPLYLNMYGWYGRKKFPMEDRANRLFLLLQQSGLQSLWAQMLSTNITAVRWQSSRASSDNGAQAIPFSRARNLFVMLGLGEAVALLAFLLEHAAARCAGTLVRKRPSPSPSAAVMRRPRHNKVTKNGRKRNSRNTSAFGREYARVQTWMVEQPDLSHWTREI